MAYRKPQVLAKSPAKKSFVAGCPTNTYLERGCDTRNTSCMIGHAW